MRLASLIAREHHACWLTAAVFMIEPLSTLRELRGTFLAAPACEVPRLWKRMSGLLKEVIQAGQTEEAAATLRTALAGADWDYTMAQSAHRIRRELEGLSPASQPKIRLAILGSFTTKQLLDLIDLFLYAAGVEATFYEANYGVFRQEILDPGSGLREFKPETIFLATTWRDLGHRPPAHAGAAEVTKTVEEASREWLGLWQKAREDLGCQIIQNNFALPAWRSYGNHEARHSSSLGRFLMLMNRAFSDAAPPYVVVHDVDHLAALAGRWRWDDARFYHQAKLPCDPECLVDYARSVVSIIAAQLGLAKKCLVLDLDNTLWGGVVGDDGIGGIRLGQGDPEGEAFLEFQNYVRGLRERGVILAVCSKNERATAEAVFREHPEMALRREDIACFVANWDDKPSNLRTIAKELNLGLDSLVFVDDNPAERAVVRQLVPEVAVPELPADVTGYIRVLEQHRYFQVLSIGAEDLQRTQFYQADASRKAAQSSVADMDSFLRSLEMVARIGPITSATLERSAQLIQRSNQFNLTTRRRSAADLSRLLQSPEWVTQTVSLADRFGDNGLISVVLARSNGHALEIDTWLMSCRVLKRGVEQMALNHLVSFAQKHGLQVVRGEYIPTSKNALVEAHYAGLGFTQTGKDADGKTRWELLVSTPSKPLTTFIKEMEDHGQITR
jgi:FkbH-like protein